MLGAAGSLKMTTSVAPGTTVSCSFTKTVQGNVGSGDVTDKATAKVTDDEGTLAQDTGTATVTIKNVAPSITVTKTAVPSSVDEGGAGSSVVYTLKIKNTSVSTDPVVI